MAILASDCDILIPQYRWNSYCCLATGVAVILGGALLSYLARSWDQADIGTVGSVALTSVGFLPFRGYYQAAQRARLLEKVRRLIERGETLSPTVEGLVQKVMLEATDV